MKKFYRDCILEELNLDKRMSMKYFEDHQWNHKNTRHKNKTHSPSRYEKKSSDSSERDDLSSSTNSSFFYVSSDHSDGCFDNPTGDFYVKQNKKEATIGTRFTLK